MNSHGLRHETDISTGELRYKALIENCFDGIAVIDEAMRFTYATSSLQRMLGFSAAELQDNSFEEYVHAGDLETWRQLVARLKEYGRAPAEGLIKVMHKDGSWKHVRLRVTGSFDKPYIDGYILNFKDVTEKQITKRQLEFDRRNMDALVNSAPGLVWSIDTAYRLITANRAFVDTINMISAADIKPGDSVLIPYFPGHEAIVDQWKRWYDRALGGESFVLEHYEAFYGAWAETCFSPIFENGTVIGAAGFTTNITDRKRSVELLRQSEQMMADAQKVGGFGSWELDLSQPNLYDNELRWSDEVFRLFGYSPQAINVTVSTFFGMVHADDVECLASGFTEAIKAGKRFTATHRIITAGGEVKWVNEDAGILADEATGKPLKITGTIHDITDAKKAEEELKESYAALSKALGVQTSILNALPAHIALLDKDGVIIEVNESWKRFGRENGLRSRDFCKGDNYLEIADNSGDDGEGKQAAAGIRAVIAGETDQFDIEYPCHSDQCERWFRMAVTPLHTATQGAVVMHLDITDRRKAQMALVKSEASLTTIFNSTDVAYTLLDSDFKVVAYNLTASTIVLELRDMQLATGKSFLDYLPEAEQREKAAVALFYVRQGQDIKYETRIVDLLGKEKWYLVRISKVSSGNRTLGICIATTDITEAKTYETEREKITADLTQRNMHLEQFTYIVSHNLRAPLANIMAFTEELKDEQLDEEHRQVFIEELSSSVEKLDNVIKDLNQILQVNKQITRVREQVSFRELVHDIQKSVSQLIAQHDVTITTNFSEVEDIITLKSYLYSIFYNLISNSIKYRRDDAAPVITITSKKANNNVVLRFTDNGTGINLDRNGSMIFGLYKRFHTNIEGKGIGLFMTRTQVEALGGTIEVESQVNSGTTFIITLSNKTAKDD
ncbi:MAG: PAS domain S-box protein [Bacteroidota bacterium]